MECPRCDDGTELEIETAVQDGWDHSNDRHTTKEIEIDGVLTKVPTSIVNVMPCSVTDWTDEGLAVLESIIGSWNNQNPTKIIGVPYTFESYTDLIAFRDGKL